MPDLNHPSFTSPSQGTDTPFMIVLHQRDRTPAGDFRPEATVTIRPALRTSGLLAALPPEDAKSLLLLLTFVTANGWCRPALPELAEAMCVGEGKARARMRRLAEFLWRGWPLVTEVGGTAGLVRYAPSPAVVEAPQAAPEPSPTPPPEPQFSSRDAIIAHSRALYATPRAEVERGIAERMGWGPPAFDGDAPTVAGKREAYRRMTDRGVPKEQAVDLLARFDLSRIEPQLDWLPHRNAKSPARLLVAAIEHDYEAPPMVRLEQSPALNVAPEPARQVLPAPDAEAPPEGEPSAPSTNAQEGP